MISSVSADGSIPASSTASRTSAIDVAVLQLLHGQVDAHRESRRRGEVVPHPSCVATALAQHPPPDRDDQAGLLGERDELVRRDHSALRMAPAEQRLDAARCCRRRAGPPAGSAARAAPSAIARCSRCELEAGEHALVHLGLEHPVAALAVALGAVHRGVGVADQLLRADGARPASTTEMPMLHRSDELLVAGAQRRGQRLEHAVSRVGRLLHARRCPRAAARTRRRRSARRCRSRGCSSPAASPTSTSTSSPAA